MKLYVICDLEGTVGVVDHREQCWPDGKYFEQARRLATTELNSLIEGAIEGGAEEVYIWDGHCGFPGIIDIEQLHPCGRLIMAAGEGGPVALDESFDGLFLYGLHGMAGTRNAVLSHSFAPHIEEVWINDIKVGEIGYNAALAGSMNIPTVFISGDKAAVLEAKALIPQIEGVAVKEGLCDQPAGINTCPTISLSPKKTCEMIRQSSCNAAKKCKEIEPLKISLPYNLRIKYYEKKYADNYKKIPCAKRVDDFTIQMQKDIFSELEF